MKAELVQILLSTYNGQTYLKQQIESIINQSYSNWELLVKDDGSTDQTMTILRAFMEDYPNKIRLIEGQTYQNASESFMALVQESKASYVMFCDQDDVWNEDKIALSIVALKRLENNFPAALVCTDMEVVDNELKRLFPSFMKQQRIRPIWIKSRTNVMAQSMVAGCTMMFTDELIKRLKPINASLFQHDHWVLINAKCLGSVQFLPLVTMKYRQHGKNAIGSHAINSNYFVKRSGSFTTILKRWHYLRKWFKPKPSYMELFVAKFKLNFLRLIGA